MILELQTFDITTSGVERFATGSFWAGLSRVCTGFPAAKLLMISDTLKPADIIRGYRHSTVAAQDMPTGVRAYGVQYEDYLESVAREVRYMRMFLILNTNMEESSLIQLLAANNLVSWPVRDEIPIPFSKGTDAWSHVACEDGMQYTLLRSKIRQSGAIYPRSLHRLFSLEFPVWAALNVHTFSSQDAEKLLRMKGVAAKHSSKSNSSTEDSMEAGDVLNTVEDIRRQMNRYGAGLHVTRLYVVVSGSNGTELRNRKNIVQGAVPLQMHTAPAGELPQIFSAKPITSTEGTVMTTPGVSILAGSAMSFKRRTETHGVLMGVDPNQSLIIFDMFNDRNPSYNMNVLGQTGSGKTFGVLTMMIRHMLLGCRLVIIDPQGNIDLSFLGNDCHIARLGTKAAAINILDITRDELTDQVASVKNTLRMLGVLSAHSPLEDSVLDDVLIDIYDPIWNLPGRESMVPTLAKLQQRVENTANKVKHPAMKDAAEQLSILLTPYTRGSLSDLFGQHTTVDFALNRPVTIYDVSRLPDPTMGGKLRTALLAILVADINASIRRLRRNGDTTPILFFVDEMGILMRDAVVAAYISAEYKTSRSRRVGMIVADQDLHSMLGPQDEHGVHHGIPILANSAFSLIFRQKASEKAMIREHFPDLPAEMVNRLPMLRQGTCVASLPDDLLTVHVTPSPLDGIILSSRLEDRKKAKELTKRLMAEIGL